MHINIGYAVNLPFHAFHLRGQTNVVITKNIVIFMSSKILTHVQERISLHKSITFKDLKAVSERELTMNSSGDNVLSHLKRTE